MFFFMISLFAWTKTLQLPEFFYGALFSLNNFYISESKCYITGFWILFFPIRSQLA